MEGVFKMLENKSMKIYMTKRVVKHVRSVRLRSKEYLHDDMFSWRIWMRFIWWRWFRKKILVLYSTWMHSHHLITMTISNLLNHWQISIVPVILFVNKFYYIQAKLELLLTSTYTPPYAWGWTPTLDQNGTDPLQ